MLPRFFAPQIAGNVQGAEVALPDEEATHLTRVLRLRAGDEVRVFDGRGSEWRAQVASASKQRASVTLLEPWAPAAESRVPITLAVAALKGDKMDDVVRDAVMMGVTAMQPLVTERSEISLSALVRGNRVERWTRIAVSSVKQCGRAVVPAIAPPRAFGDWIRSVAAPTLLFVEPSAGQPAIPLSQVERSTVVALVVGPEGGWSDEELAAARQPKITFVSLGARTLRADAMPVIAITAVRALWEDL